MRSLLTKALAVFRQSPTILLSGVIIAFLIGLSICAVVTIPLSESMPCGTSGPSRQTGWTHLAMPSLLGQTCFEEMICPRL